jgi:hypothetical protein
MAALPASSTRNLLRPTCDQSWRSMEDRAEQFPGLLIIEHGRQTASANLAELTPP